eukprot:GHVU01095821.1.p1 GENE.GHVU01095821.1~~GHVU01095821.1.p1  ORF type:complete len:190 (+),score=8.61 GHVU01095821.1:204-773(+)
MPQTDFDGGAFLIKPYRTGPDDRLRLDAAGWHYQQVRMDAHAFLAVNEGRLSLRGIPLPVMNEDKWETAMSSRSLVQYWFDARDKQTPNANDWDTRVNVWTGPNTGFYYEMMNYVSPWGNDSSLWDYQIAEIPQGTVTIGILRPLRRKNLPAGWYRHAQFLPTRSPARPSVVDGVIRHDDLFAQADLCD